MSIEMISWIGPTIGVVAMLYLIRFAEYCRAQAAAYRQQAERILDTGEREPPPRLKSRWFFWWREVP